MALPVRLNGSNIDASWWNDIKNELESAGSSMDAFALLDGRAGDILKIDDIREFTLDNGIIIEGLRLKDNTIIDTTSNLGVVLKSNDTVTQATINQSGLKLSTGSTVNKILDQDDLSGDDATALATQQSIKAFGENLSFNNMWIGDSTNIRKQVNTAGATSTSEVLGRVVESTVTISVASPAVVTDTGHGANSGDKVIFSTTGSLPTGLSTGTIYYIKVVDANTYKVSASIANLLAETFVNTTGAGSGTHTAIRNGLYYYSGLLRGTYTNDNASQGYVGEYLSSIASTPSSVGATGTTISAATLELTAGDWECSFNVSIRPNGASFSAVNTIVAITGTAGNSLTGYAENVTGTEANSEVLTTFILLPLKTPVVRVQSDGVNLYINGVTFSSTQILQGKLYVGNFTVATPTYTSCIKARRVR